MSSTPPTLMLLGEISGNQLFSRIPCLRNRDHSTYLNVSLCHDFREQTVMVTEIKNNIPYQLKRNKGTIFQNSN